jgi:DNA-binding NarL/FixJ family response regulator
VGLRCRRADVQALGDLGVRQPPPHQGQDLALALGEGGQLGRRRRRLDRAGGELGNVRVLMLTTFDLDDYVYAAIRAGASGFMLKDARPEDILAAVRVVAAGDSLLAPSVTRRLIAELAARPVEAPSPPAELAALTEREREVLALVGRGLSNAEIAERLYVSPATAKTHVSHIMTKLYARDRAQLVVLAYESGLVRPGM